MPVQTLDTRRIIMLVAPNPVPHLNDAAMRVGVLHVLFRLVQIVPHSHAKPPQPHDLLLLLPLYHVVLRGREVVHNEEGNPLPSVVVVQHHVLVHQALPAEPKSGLLLLQ